jgi:hypothetical protein
MTDYASTSPRVPATSRTWATVSHDCMDGVVVAQVDGQPADVLEADAILRHATTRTVIHEIIPVPAGMLAAFKGAAA